jgi:hypothetical protein
MDPISTLATTTACVQGGYYFKTGLWPMVHRRSFESVTGPKTDWWLVITVGALACAIGSALLIAVGCGMLSRAVAVFAILTAGAFLAVDLLYALRGRISAVYLLDAAFEAFLLVLWIIVLSKNGVA